MENKRDKFVELAEKRVNNTLKNIQLIGNLANTSNYDYTEEDVRKIFKAIKDEISMCEIKFKNKTKNNGFKL